MALACCRGEVFCRLAASWAARLKDPNKTTPVMASNGNFFIPPPRLRKHTPIPGTLAANRRLWKLKIFIARIRSYDSAGIRRIGRKGNQQVSPNRLPCRARLGGVLPIGELSGQIRAAHYPSEAQPDHRAGRRLLRCRPPKPRGYQRTRAVLGSSVQPARCGTRRAVIAEQAMTFEA